MEISLQVESSHRHNPGQVEWIWDAFANLNSCHSTACTRALFIVYFYLCSLGRHRHQLSLQLWQHLCLCHLAIWRIVAWRNRTAPPLASLTLYSGSRRLVQSHASQSPYFRKRCTLCFQSKWTTHRAELTLLGQVCSDLALNQAIDWWSRPSSPNLQTLWLLTKPSWLYSQLWHS